MTLRGAVISVVLWVLAIMGCWAAAWLVTWGV